MDKLSKSRYVSPQFITLITSRLFSFLAIELICGDIIGKAELFIC
jgi:hypothetical protein